MSEIGVEVLRRNVRQISAHFIHSCNAFGKLRRPDNPPQVFTTCDRRFDEQ